MDEKFCKLSIDKILEYSKESSFAIYLRLSSSKFVKVVNIGDDALEEIVDDYVSRGLATLYVEREVFEKFQERIEEALNKNFKDIGISEDISERYDGLASALYDVKSLVRSLGMTEMNIKLGDQLIEAAIDQSEKITNLELLLELLNDKEGFITKHAFLTSYVVTNILEKMNWSTKDIKKKLIMASLFQNIALETDEQAMIYTQDSDDFRALDEFSKDIVLKHPLLAADLVRSPSFAGEEVEKLIRNHHEVPISGAFPGRVSAHNVPILDACFILSGYFSYKVLTQEGEESYSLIAQQLNEDFNIGGFKRALVALLAALRLQ
jgi:tetratricopeptide (TPR) repeat protein